MKRYYYKFNEKEMVQLKKDLAFYAEIKGYDFQFEEEGIRYVCQFRRNKHANKAVTVIFRHNISTRLTIQMGIIDWINGPLLDAFFPELEKDIYEVTPVPLLDHKEKEMRHDVKLLIKIRLGNYFDHRDQVK